MDPKTTLSDSIDPAAAAAADARGCAVAAGGLIGHDAVKRWIASWGSKDPLPRPAIGD